MIYDHDKEAQHNGQAVNNIANNKILSFYVGDDCYKEMMEQAGDIPEKLGVIGRDGVEVHGIHVGIRFVAGGDYKLLRA